MDSSVWASPEDTSPPDWELIRLKEATSAEESGKTGGVTGAVSTPVGAPRKDLMLRHTVTRHHTLASRLVQSFAGSALRGTDTPLCAC